MISKKTALVVDDEEVVRALFSRILGAESFRVETARDGVEAVEKAAQSDFDLIFMDVKLPGKNGVDAFKEIKNSGSEATVIMMTGYAVEKEIEEALRLGARGCLKKPFDIEEIAEILRKHDLDLPRGGP